MPVAVSRPWKIHRATFSGVAGQQVAIGYDTLATTEFDRVCVQVELVARTGERLLQRLGNGFSHCTDQDTSAVAVPVTLPETGEYSLEVNVGLGASGSLDVSVS